MFIFWAIYSRHAITIPIAWALSTVRPKIAKFHIACGPFYKDLEKIWGRVDYYMFQRSLSLSIASRRIIRTSVNNIQVDQCRRALATCKKFARMKAYMPVLLMCCYTNVSIKEANTLNFLFYHISVKVIRRFCNLR